VRAGDHALLLDTVSLPRPVAVFEQPSLNAFMSLGSDAWSSVGEAVRDYMDRGADLVPLEDLEVMMPVEIGDYVDFYSSLHHATNLGRLFRPDSEPLLPNWRHLPVGYHGRSGSVVVSGTPIRRPRGPIPDASGKVALRATEALDIELEVGFIVGQASKSGSPIKPDDADKHVFGVLLVNDWSARDIQAFEYQPLGPFLGKSFATSIAAWVTPLDALRPFLVPAPKQDPPPDEYLRGSRPWGLDLDLTVELNDTRIAETGFGDLYWTFAQQLAHMTINGASVRTGDLFASGTVSGPDPGTYGSLIELTSKGAQPIELSDGSKRDYLRDGDTVTLRGSAGTTQLAECIGTIEPA
jgi:fumarylacetoacetase